MDDTLRQLVTDAEIDFKRVEQYRKDARNRILKENKNKAVTMMSIEAVQSRMMKVYEQCRAKPAYLRQMSHTHKMERAKYGGMNLSNFLPMRRITMTLLMGVKEGKIPDFVAHQYLYQLHYKFRGSYASVLIRRYYNWKHLSFNDYQIAIGDKVTYGVKRGGTEKWLDFCKKDFTYCSKHGQRLMEKLFGDDFEPKKLDKKGYLPLGIDQLMEQKTESNVTTYHPTSKMKGVLNYIGDNAGEIFECLTSKAECSMIGTSNSFFKSNILKGVPRGTSKKKFFINSFVGTANLKKYWGYEGVAKRTKNNPMTMLKFALEGMIGITLISDERLVEWSTTFDNNRNHFYLREYTSEQRYESDWEAPGEGKKKSLSNKKPISTYMVVPQYNLYTMNTGKLFVRHVVVNDVDDNQKTVRTIIPEDDKVKEVDNCGDANIAYFVEDEGEAEMEELQNGNILYTDISNTGVKRYELKPEAYDEFESEDDIPKFLVKTIEDTNYIDLKGNKWLGNITFTTRDKDVVLNEIKEKASEEKMVFNFLGSVKEEYVSRLTYKLPSDYITFQGKKDEWFIRKSQDVRYTDEFVQEINWMVFKAVVEKYFGTHYVGSIRNINHTLWGYAGKSGENHPSHIYLTGPFFPTPTQTR